jgi:hypothetical protein
VIVNESEAHLTADLLDGRIAFELANAGLDVALVVPATALGFEDGMHADHAWAALHNADAT